MSISNFDKAINKFTNAMYVAADWKNYYFGAAYSTRLSQAIDDVRLACNAMEEALIQDKAK